MAIERLTEETVAKIARALTSKLSNEDASELSNIVEQALVDAVRELTHRYREAAVSAVGADADKAHKIAEGLRQAQTAIIANLQGLR